MRDLLLLPFVLSSIHAMTQVPEIGTAQFFQVGQSYQRDTYDIHPDTLATLVGSGGANYAIDLAWVLDAPHYTTDSIVCITAPGAYMFFSEYYDTANVQITITELGVNAISEYLFLAEPGRVRYVGGQPNGAWGTGDDLVFQRYTNNGFEHLLIDGMSLGTTWTEAIDARTLDASGSDDHYQVGEATTLVDGYGTVTLPNGTVLPNTVRVRTVYDYLDINAFFGDTQHNDTLYTWWVAGSSGPLMTLPVGHYPVTHGYVSPLPFALYRHDAATSMAAQANATPTVFPNPCSDQLQVRHSAGLGPGYLITDMLGRSVGAGDLTSQGSINTAALSPGSYLLHLPGEHHRQIRFVVQR